MNLKKFSTLTLCIILAQSPLAATAFTHAPAHSTTSGLNYRIIQDSHGNKPTLNDEVEIRFTSYNSKGEVLEGTLNGVPVILPVSEMFTGLKESLLLMPAGATYEFDIPAHLGYQEEGKSGRQAAKYRIELLRINP
ncbi:FKBP-type peptidyl-prolyl cis-trans isomerase [Moraxella nasicaprae]|uniref:Peptidyl-prolyl cis-trans isomerase n=1 Tax=Moraxella nasicaprae TaxID=2904122 RepID=A0ABY6F2T0_9GAMM|nr:FKBP-type peptidyl-prolyl cis-trans isomerase [Moraxella nasicaprae]UXZ04401.1 FKBP-type peptidyl-prolyl cis-trans isomerase [Moraxella nasicaprae]